MLGKAWQQDAAKWTKLGPSWQQVAVKSCQDAAKIASLVTLYLLLERFLTNFGCFLCLLLRVGGKSKKYENEEQSITFA
jgi:hypothetical protein